MRVHLWTSNNEFYYAEFSGVTLQDSSKRFALSIGGYIGGSAGDGGFGSYNTPVAFTYGPDVNCTGYGVQWWYLAEDEGCVKSLLFGVLGSSAQGGLIWSTLQSPIDKIIVKSKLHDIDIGEG